jgi:hypothetical protein
MIRMGSEFISTDLMYSLLHSVTGTISEDLYPIEVLLFINSTIKTIEKSVTEITEDNDNS